jgi:hypothetical protein
VAVSIYRLKDQQAVRLDCQLALPGQGPVNVLAVDNLLVINVTDAKITFTFDVQSLKADKPVFAPEPLELKRASNAGPFACASSIGGR